MGTDEMSGQIAPFGPPAERHDGQHWNLNAFHGHVCLQAPGSSSVLRTEQKRKSQKKTKLMLFRRENSPCSSWRTACSGLMQVSCTTRHEVPEHRLCMLIKDNKACHNWTGMEGRRDSVELRVEPVMSTAG